MGTVAEPVLLEAAPSANADICLAAIQLLGRIGTADSLPMLRKAKRSPNLQIRDAAQQSHSQITARIKNADGS